ncbi:RHS repeat-associated core domain-containing protein, partial [Burkholderia pyrrocinia]
GNMVGDRQDGAATAAPSDKKLGKITSTKMGSIYPTLTCGFTLYGWDGDTLAWESRIADEDGFGARTTHYVYEPGSFVPVAQAVRQDAILLHDQPEYGDYYRQDEDPLWLPPPPAPAIDSLAWYQCDHLGTPQELTDEHSEIAWSAEYRAWGVVKEVIRKASGGRVEVRNPIRFQGQYHDHETGLHYNRHRYYDSYVGRYISRDPIGLFGGLNFHIYPLNPNNRIDPRGLEAEPKPCAQRILDAVHRLNNQNRYSYESGYGFGEGKNKCNLFISDVLEEAGVKSPRRTRFGIPRGPLTAGAWADPRASIPGFQTVFNPIPGDIVAIGFDYSDATGHVAVVTDVNGKSGKTIGAGSGGSHTTTWPWDGQSPKGTPVYHRCID